MAAAAFTCLWCGSTYEPRGDDALERHARLCADCLSRADENPFLRYRLRKGLVGRAAPTPVGPIPDSATPPTRDPGRSEAVGASELPAVRDLHGVDARAGQDAPDGFGDGPEAMIAYYEARAPEYDDFYLRRGRYERGPVHDLPWQMELDIATTWLDRLPIGGRIVELAAGTGWWSGLLATKGELWLSDAAEAPLDRARERLLAHGLRAHLHLRDAWAEPDGPADALFTGFWLSHVPRSRLALFLGLARRWLRPGGIFAFVDSRPDPQSGAVDQPPAPGADLSRRRLADGREFTIPKVHYSPDELAGALRAAGFEAADVTTTGRFFLLGRATA